MGAIKDPATGRMVVNLFGLTVREEPLYWVNLYPGSEEDVDALFLLHQDLAVKEREKQHKTVGRMKRKVLAMERVVGVCWYWSYDG